jgi:hypothetical protein
MRQGMSYWIHRFAAVAALCGIAAYSALIPGHVVSQATLSMLGGAQAEPALEPICHGGVATTRDSSAPSGPTAPQKKCPFCTGYAAFMTAIAGNCDAGVLDADLASPTFAVLDDGFVEGFVGRPQNRGPPLDL